MVMKRYLCFLFAICLLVSLEVCAFAKSYPSTDAERAECNFSVYFNSDGRSMSNTFQKGLNDISVRNELEDRLRTLQPGDSVTFTINLRNDYSKSTNWYMTSKIVASLEEGSARDGAYTYYLRYINNSDSSKNQDIFQSGKVGGFQSQGLEEINKALKEDYNKDGEKYFYLDNLGRGQGGQVLLTVSLDGETQGNTYQDRLADLKMNFAVQIQEPTGTTTTTTNRTAPRTGDSHNLLPYYIAMIISGLLFLYFALDAYTDRLYKKGK